jgi:RNA polymerase sigma-70 factor (ECF subfamily)
LPEADFNTPEKAASEKESESLLRNAIAQLPYEQREVVVLHIRGGLTFRQIAAMQDVSINTVQGRYRYGLDKLRTMLNGQVSE